MLMHCSVCHGVCMFYAEKQILPPRKTPALVAVNVTAKNADANQLAFMQAFANHDALANGRVCTCEPQSGIVIDPYPKR